MAKEEIRVARIKIILDDGDQTYTEISAVMPYEVGEKLVMETMNWKENWSASFKEVENYFEAENKFFEKEKEKKLEIKK